jgi:hypothetical protein
MCRSSKKWQAANPLLVPNDSADSPATTGVQLASLSKPTDSLTKIDKRKSATGVRSPSGPATRSASVKTNRARNHKIRSGDTLFSLAK